MYPDCSIHCQVLNDVWAFHGRFVCGFGSNDPTEKMNEFEFRNFSNFVGVLTNLSALQYTVDNSHFVFNVDQFVNVSIEFRWRLLNVFNWTELSYQAIQLLRKFLLCQSKLNSLGFHQFYVQQTDNDGNIWWHLPGRSNSFV